MASNAEESESEKMSNAYEGIMSIVEEETAIIPTTVAEAIENEYVFKNKGSITDGLNNTIYVPGGFHLDKESNTDEEGNAITVEDGIVIEDSQGNQFVWIPTGTYQTSSGAKTNELTRRQWGSRDSDTEPTPISGDSVINSYYYGEGATQDSSGSAITPVETNIEAFKTSVATNGGFYIGRYEAGTETERTSENDELTTPLVQANKEAYVYVTRDQAKEQAEAMYSDNSEITATAELISSYAWDTALNFICQNSDVGYTLATTTDDAYGNIGTNNKTQAGEYPADGYSNIYDFLGNCYEWTTEYSSYTSSYDAYLCVDRGGYCNGSIYYAANRRFDTTDTSNSFLSFRLQLYV